MTKTPSDPLVGLDGARRAGWARAYAAEAKVAELTADLPRPCWSMRVDHEHAIHVQPRDGSSLTINLKEDDIKGRDGCVMFGSEVFARISLDRARHLARSLIAAVQYAEAHLPLPEPTRLVAEPATEGEQ